MICTGCLGKVLDIVMSREFFLGVVTALTGTVIARQFLSSSSKAVASSAVSSKKSKKSKPLGNKYEAGEEMKMVLLVRSDLNMGKGKAAAQACHAVLAAYKDAQRRDPAALDAWEAIGQTKVTLRVESEEELLSLVKKARECGIISQYIRDAGRTQVAPNTATVAAVGPAPRNVVDLITGHLKLY